MSKIPEAVLVSILSFVLQKVNIEEAVAYYSTVPLISQKGARAFKPIHRDE